MTLECLKTPNLDYLDVFITFQCEYSIIPMKHCHREGNQDSSYQLVHASNQEDTHFHQLVNQSVKFPSSQSFTLFPVFSYSIFPCQIYTFPFFVPYYKSVMFQIIPLITEILYILTGMAFVYFLTYCITCRDKADQG